MSADHELLPKALSLSVHELRTPVTVVGGYLRMLLREQGGPLTDKQRKMLEEAEKSCGRIGTVVAEMSDMGKLESNQLAIARQSFDLATTLTELAGSMQEGEDRGIRLELRGTETPIPVTGDRARLSNALRALMHSALRERGEPGVVVVECSRTTGTDQQEYVVIAVGDNSVLPLLTGAACGTPPEFDEWRGGMGLALPVARRVIEAHGGALWSAAGAQSRAAAALRLPLGA